MKEDMSPRSQRIDALFDIRGRLYQARHDLRNEFPNPQGPDFWFWLMWQGKDEFAEVRHNLYPLPPRRLLERVVGQSSDEVFHRGGLVDWRRVESCLREHGYDFARPGVVLDFGCGCARLTRFFSLYSPTTTFVGVDVDREAISWCQANIDFARFESVNHDPRTQFSAGSFNGVYSYSVFSHLSEERQMSWLEELHRIAAPNAVLVLTTQGEEVMRLILDGKRDGVFPPRELLELQVESIRQSGFGFFPYRTLAPADPDASNPFESWDLEAYGATFVLESYIARKWTRYFDLVAYDVAPDGWQDFVVLRRRP